MEVLKKYGAIAFAIVVGWFVFTGFMIPSFLETTCGLGVNASCRALDRLVELDYRHPAANNNNGGGRRMQPPERFDPMVANATHRPPLGQPGGGYVAGAPRNPQECAARGGLSIGRGCAGYR